MVSFVSLERVTAHPQTASGREDGNTEGDILLRHATVPILVPTAAGL